MEFDYKRTWILGNTGERIRREVLRKDEMVETRKCKAL